jgi:hypothetical protein
MSSDFYIPVPAFTQAELGAWGDLERRQLGILDARREALTSSACRSPRPGTI